MLSGYKLTVSRVRDVYCIFKPTLKLDEFCRIKKKQTSQIEKRNDNSRKMSLIPTNTVLCHFKIVYVKLNPIAPFFLWSPDNFKILIVLRFIYHDNTFI